MIHYIKIRIIKIIILKWIKFYKKLKILYTKMKIHYNKQTKIKSRYNKTMKNNVRILMIFIKIVLIY